MKVQEEQAVARTAVDAAADTVTASAGVSAEKTAHAIARTEESQAVRTRQRYFMIALVALALYVCRDFLVPLAWAGILAICIWPLYARALTSWRMKPSLAALSFTLATALLVMLPIGIAASAIAQESGSALGWLQEVQKTGLAAPHWLSTIPLLGERATEAWNSRVGTPQAASQLLGGLNAGTILGTTRAIGGQVAHASMLFFITLLILFGMLIRGRDVADQACAVSIRALGPFGQRFVEHLSSAVRATVVGTVLVAVGEGTIIGIGYWAAGVPRPLLFAILTIFVAMLPFGAWFAFSLATVLLLVQGQVMAAVLLFAFACAVMFVGDNIVQPAIIGNSVRLPFALALLGTFGGLASLGIVGVFVGPVLMAALLLAWHQWFAAEEESPGPVPAEPIRR